MLGLPLDAVSTIATVGFLVCLLLTACFAMLVWRANALSQSNRDMRLQALGTLLTTQLADAQARVNEAETKAVAAERDAATARERASDLAAKADVIGQDSEEERVARKKLQASLMWRRIDVTAFKAMAAILSKNPSDVNVMVVANDQEALFFARQICDLFTQSGWHPQLLVASYPSTVFFNITVDKGNNVQTQTVMSALAAGGIVARNFVLPDPAFWFSGSPDKSFPVSMLIGSKPPP